VRSQPGAGLDKHYERTLTLEYGKYFYVAVNSGGLNRLLRAMKKKPLEVTVTVLMNWSSLQPLDGKAASKSRRKRRGQC